MRSLVVVICLVVACNPAMAQQPQDPGAIAGLALWLKAGQGVELDAQGRVAVWQDQSTNQFKVVQENPAWRPTVLSNAVNGHDAIRFAGWETGQGAKVGGTPLACPEFARIQGKAVTVAAVVRDWGVSYLPTLVALQGNGFNLSRVATDAGAPAILLRQQNEWIMPGEGSLSGAGFVTLVAQSDAHGTRLYANGDLLANSPTALTAGQLGPLVVGAWDNGQIRGSWRGELAELAVFNRALTDAEHRDLLRAWKTKYRLGDPITPLAGKLPFAYYPSRNELEVAFDAASPLAMLASGKSMAPALPGAGGNPGVSFSYFEGTWPGELPDFSTVKSKETGIAKELTIGRRVGAGGLRFDYAVNYAVEGRYEKPQEGVKSAWVFDGSVAVPDDGLYTFFLRPFAVARLTIDGNLVADNRGANSLNWRGGLTKLAKGRHSLRLEVGGGTHCVEVGPALVRVLGPGVPLQPLPASWLSQGAAAPLEKLADSAPAFPEILPFDSQPASLQIRMFRAEDASRSPVAKGTLALDGQHRGQGRINVPDLKDGEYAVEYVYRGVTIPATQLFRRERFPFEGNAISLEHKVLPPFTPVQVEKQAVSVVGRTYRFNAFGLCDSIVSLDRELLAGPMRIVAETAGGPLVWTPGRVRGRAIHPDQAEIHAESRSSVVVLRSKTLVEEDGAAKVSLTLAPGAQPATIERLWVEIPLRDQEAPLFHYALDNSMRCNFGGTTPRGPNIQWNLKTGPVVWTASDKPGEGPARPAGWLWDSATVPQIGNPLRASFRPYVQYLYLGAEERGFAWFGDCDAGYRTLPGRPIQTLTREGDRLLLRVELIQTPTVIAGETVITLGFQASPSKPLPPDWRTAEVSTGCGAVVCWGGYLCCDKYPDGRDFTIVDKILEPRKTGKVDVEWFKKKDAERMWGDTKVLGYSEWLEAQVGWFANSQVNATARPGTYFEEHIIHNREPEWQVFQDEWANEEFNRFQPSDAAFTVSARSYQDFCLYFAREWNRRGVSLYFDNTFPHRSNNPLNSQARRGGLGSMLFSDPIWASREYYKRMWKLARGTTLQGSPVDFTLHMTNTKILPWSTWTTATLDNEASYRQETKNENGTNVPWPPDYVRAVTLSRQSGSVAYTLDPLRNWDNRHEFYRGDRPQFILPQLSDWGMSAVHEVRGRAADSALGRAHQQILLDFGYGKDEVEVGNYWSEKPMAQVTGGEIKWLALRKKTATAARQALLLLQSYEARPATALVRFGDDRWLADVRTRERFQADKDGVIAVPLNWEYATRLLVAANDPKDLPSAKPGQALFHEDFECGEGMQFSQNARAPWIQREADSLQAGNHVLRFQSGPMLFGITPNWILSDRTTLTNFHLAFRMRLPKLPEGPNSNGLLLVRYGDTGKGDCYYRVMLDIDANTPDKRPTWSFSVLAAGTAPKMGAPTVNLTNDNLADGKAKPVLALGTADTAWHRIEIEVKGRRHTLSFDGRIVFDAEAEGPCAGGLHIGTGWRLQDKLTVEIDDVVVLERDR